MTKVYVVTREEGQYSDYSMEVVAICSTIEVAKEQAEVIEKEHYVSRLDYVKAARARNVGSCRLESTWPLPKPYTNLEWNDDEDGATADGIEHGWDGNRWQIFTMEVKEPVKPKRQPLPMDWTKHHMIKQDDGSEIALDKCGCGIGYTDACPIDLHRRRGW